MARQPWARLTINLEPAVAELVKRRAKLQRRSAAAYLQTLIERDLARTAAAYPEIDDTDAAAVAEVNEADALIEAAVVRHGQAAAAAETMRGPASSGARDRSPRAKGSAIASATPGSKVKAQASTPVGAGRAGL